MRTRTTLLPLQRLTLLATAIAVLSAVPARAATMVAVLTQSNESNIGPDGGNYGTVTLDDSTTDNTLSSGTVRLVLAINPTRTGDSFQTFGFNSIASLGGATINVIETPNTAVWTSSGSGNQDGFGKFDALVVGNGDGDRVTTATILVSNLGVDGTVANFLKLSSNPGGEGAAVFAAHLIPLTGKSGYVGARLSDVRAVPEPSTFALGLGALGLLGLAGLRRRRPE